MPYGDIVTRSFAIWWRHKYLWLLGLLGGGAASYTVLSAGNYDLGQFSRSIRESTPQPPPPGASPPPDISGMLSSWASAHAALIETVAAALVVWTVAWFLLSSLTVPATVEAAAWEDGESRLGVRRALSVGRAFFARVLLVRLLFLVSTVAVTVALSFAETYMSIQADKGSASAASLSQSLALLSLPLFVISQVVTVFEELVVRCVVLGRQGVGASFRAAFELVKRRLGRLILLALLYIAIAVVIGLALVIVLAILGTIVFLVILPALGRGVAVVPVSVSIGLTLYVLFLAVGSVVSTYLSIYWTVAFRRLDWERRPPPPFPMYPYAYPYQPPSQQA